MNSRQMRSTNQDKNLRDNLKEKKPTLLNLVEFILADLNVL